MNVQQGPPRRVLRLVVLVALACIPTLGAVVALTRASTQGKPPRFTITDMDELTEGRFGWVATAINESGDVAGNYDLYIATRAERDQTAKAGYVQSLSGVDILGLNDRGEMVGKFTGVVNALYYRAGKAVALDEPGSRPRRANDVNERSQVVGVMEVTNRFDHAFVWQRGILTDLGTLGGRDSEATAINELGQIVGFSRVDTSWRNHAFLWENGVMRDLGAPSGRQSWATDINDRGQVVGAESRERGAKRPILWDRHRVIPITVRDDVDSTATGINNNGWVIGHTETSPPPFLSRVLRRWFPYQPERGRAFLYIDGETYDLNDLIPKDAGWVLHQAADINDRGQIVGWGKHGKETRAFLLTPQPTTTAAR